MSAWERVNGHTDWIHCESALSYVVHFITLHVERTQRTGKKWSWNCMVKYLVNCPFSDATLLTLSPVTIVARFYCMKSHEKHRTQPSLVHHSWSSDGFSPRMAWVMISVDARRRESLSSLFCRSLRSTGALLLSLAHTESAPAGAFCGHVWGSEQRWTRWPQVSERWWILASGFQKVDLMFYFTSCISSQASLVKFVKAPVLRT